MATKFFIDFLPDEDGGRSPKVDTEERVYYDTAREARAVIRENGWQEIAAVETAECF